jgi:hypothetical protein
MMPAEASVVAARLTPSGGFCHDRGLRSTRFAGDYTLYVVDAKGVPSVANHVRVVADDNNNRGKGGSDRP